MEVLSRMLDKVVGGGFVSGFTMGNVETNALMSSHLFLRMICSFFPKLT
jgi:hypothetical protein